MDELHAESKLKLEPSIFSNKKNIFYILVSLVVLSLIYIFLFSAPSDFVPGTILQISPGMTLRSVSDKLNEEHVIRSRVLFEAFAILLGGDKHIIYADYLFENKLPVFEVARRIVEGEHHMAPLTVTIPEGFNVNQIADTLSPKLPSFNKQKFLLTATLKEGYLFPDTYFFLNQATEVDVLQSMSDNFNKKIMPLLPSITATGKSEKDIITMASIIEGEAKGDKDRGVIAGILWHRIAIGMPLQVDVAKETYKTKGLPKSPIGNPGILAIEAAINPVKSPYLYYLHDKDGNIHYATTYAEHESNLLKYLTK